MSLFDMTGQVAVITGSSRGIGRATAFEMAAQGGLSAERLLSLTGLTPDVLRDNLTAHFAGNDAGWIPGCGVNECEVDGQHRHHETGGHSQAAQYREKGIQCAAFGEWQGAEGSNRTMHAALVNGRWPGAISL